MADTVSILKIWPMAIFFQRFSCCAKAAEDLRDADMVWFFLSFQEGRNMQFPGPFSPSRGSHPLHTRTWLLLTLKHTRRDDQGVRNALDISALPPYSPVTIFRDHDGFCAIWAPWRGRFGRQITEYSRIWLLNITVLNLPHFCQEQVRKKFGRRIQKHRNLWEVNFLCHCPVVEKWRLLGGAVEWGSEKQREGQGGGGI